VASYSKMPLTILTGVEGSIQSDIKINLIASLILEQLPSNYKISVFSSSFDEHNYIELFPTQEVPTGIIAHLPDNLLTTELNMSITMNNVVIGQKYHFKVILIDKNDIEIDSAKTSLFIVREKDIKGVQNV
jgi:hypothetical protein